MFGLYAAAIGNLYHLQIAKGKYYAARAESQHRLAGYLSPSRGGIYLTDKYGNSIPAAINKSYPTIFAVPKEIEDVAEGSALVASVLNLDGEKIQRAFGKSNELYKLLVKKATEEEVRKVKDANIRGVYVDTDEARYYPFGGLAAHVLGFVGSGSDGKEIGRYGIEAQFDDALAGTPGAVSGDKIEKPTPGKDVLLTIDRNVQFTAEEILARLVKTYGAAGGSVIVEDPKTGKMLALASEPTFDPNTYAMSPVEVFLNPAVQSLYEPGSIMKVVTMAAALDAGKITPDTAFYDVGFLTLNGKTIRNWDLKAYGALTMTGVIEHSVNTGAAFAEQKLGHALFRQYLANFGFSEPTNIGLPGELAGNLRNLAKNARDINFATASFGQGISVTPMELISAISAIANGGLLMQPYLQAGQSPKLVRRVISKTAAEETTRMMVSAVKGAKIADIPGYTVAGKTGTAQVAERGGYGEDVINTYAGFAPAYDPKFVILIKLDKPKGAPLAGVTVVPAFRELAEFLLQYYNVPPDNQ
ncbi:MAG: penicillin-binding protein 2 [Candidatus Harrisonbacteria bacterium]|nr:penicillin-binding protein 2 [Candidatus Harrisonbacteria bacterium]